MRPVLDTMAVVAHHQRFAPVDLTAIAHDLGIHIRQEALSDNVSGMLIRNQERGGSSGFEIVINSYHPQSRRHFTLAHEIAHFILHRDLIESGLTDNKLYRSGLPEPEEVQANRLASEMLMPAPLIREYHAQGLSTRRLAELFAVSEAAMRIRLDTLGLAQRAPTEL